MLLLHFELESEGYRRVQSDKGTIVEKMERMETMETMNPLAKPEDMLPGRDGSMAKRHHEANRSAAQGGRLFSNVMFCFSLYSLSWL